MASISDDGGGFRRIEFNYGGKRPKISLGKMSAHGANTVKRHIEEIIEARGTCRMMDDLTVKWLRDIDDTLHGKLAHCGLVAPRAAAGGSLLGPFIDSYIAMRTDIKPSTKMHLELCRRDIVGFFGENKPLADVTEGDADEFRLAIRKRLGENTVRRICGRARQFFHAAVKRRLIQSNPFSAMKGINVMANKAREHFITRDVAAKVIEACPDAQWRLLFALSRFGGLRCPSEHLALRWGDINWALGRMTVHSPKTEHHEGKGERVVPIFPELRPHLDQAYHEAPPGTEFVITKYRDRNANMRTQFERIIRSAGLTPWPKLFQNLRATRETELAEPFPIHVVCQWIGNTQAVAAKHYLQVTDEHFEMAYRTAWQPSATVGNAGQPKLATAIIAEENPAFHTCTHVQAPRVGLEPTTQRLTAACSTN
jgi:integrase